MLRGVGVPMMLLLTAGCSTGSLNSTPATQPVVMGTGGPTPIAPEDGPRYTHSDSIETSLSPLDAASVIHDVFEKFGFSMNTAGWPRSSANSHRVTSNTPGILSGDYFFAETQARTAAKEDVDATCRWIRDGKTNVLLKSNLPTVEHAQVMARIRAALASAATQPAAAEQNP